MGQTLPAVIYKLKRSKKPGLYLSILSFLVFAAITTRFTFWLKFGEGKFFFFILSVVFILLFFFAIISLIKLSKDKFTGMVILAEGMYDISIGHTYGMIQWKDITAVKVMDDFEDRKRRYIVLVLSNPEVYIGRELNQAKKDPLFSSITSMVLPYVFRIVH